MKVKEITLIIAEGCNLECKYCYQHNKMNVMMDYEMAVGIIDDTYSEISNYDVGIIHLFGGEPFLNFELIKRIDSYVLEKYSNVYFDIITNGTLVHNEIQDWVMERCERYNITLSLDGKKETHDMNRPIQSGKSSFDLIDLNFFRKMKSNCAIRMTISDITLPFFAENVIWINQQGFLCQALFAMGVKWDLNENKKQTLKEQLDKLKDYYIENDDKELCLALRYNPNDIYIDPCTQKKICAFSENPCYGTDGHKYYCTGFSKITLGKDYSKFEAMCGDFSIEGKKSVCLNCNLCVLCKRVKLCYASNYQATGDIYKISEDQCYINRECIKASMKIQRERLNNKYKNNCIEQREYESEYRAIIRVCKELDRIS
ncbi:radical SAM protein [Zhenpiania hominis]|uniref:radical SAM protein n=1 Tax=Zhenpiania hominis TaxID=2763644 RepID=UPI0039F518BB